MHNHIVDQIKSYAGENYVVDNGTKGIIIKNNYKVIPNIPEQFISNKLSNLFVDGTLNSPYFIK